VDHARRAGPQRLAEDDPRPRHVDGEDVIRARAQRGHAGHMEDALHAAHRAPHRGAVEHVALGELDVEAVQLVERRALAHEHPHVVAALDQQPRDVRPDETRRPCDKGRHRR
jgi:hypothetical protein